MQIVAFILAIVAAVLFFFHGYAPAAEGRPWSGRSFLSLGLGFLTVAWILQVCWLAGSHITF